MHVFVEVLDFLVNLPLKSVSEHAIFKNFLGGHAPRPPSNSMLCMLVMLCTTYKPSIILETSHQNF